jgi:hypothetical protein
MLAIYTKKSIKGQISDLASDEARVGIMGKMASFHRVFMTRHYDDIVDVVVDGQINHKIQANKGAVCARFRLFESHMCFVASHLAAGQSKVEKRNLDYTTVNFSRIFRSKNFLI